MTIRKHLDNTVLDWEEKSQMTPAFGHIKAFPRCARSSPHLMTSQWQGVCLFGPFLGWVGGGMKRVGSGAMPFHLSASQEIIRNTRMSLYMGWVDDGNLDWCPWALLLHGKNWNLNLWSLACICSGGTTLLSSFWEAHGEFLSKFLGTQASPTAPSPCHQKLCWCSLLMR